MSSPSPAGKVRGGFGVAGPCPDSGRPGLPLGHCTSFLTHPHCSSCLLVPGSAVSFLLSPHPAVPQQLLLHPNSPTDPKPFPVSAPRAALATATPAQLTEVTVLSPTRELRVCAHLCVCRCARTASLGSPASATQCHPRARRSEGPRSRAKCRAWPAAEQPYPGEKATSNPVLPADP